MITKREDKCNIYLPSHDTIHPASYPYITRLRRKPPTSSWRMNAERVSAKTMLAMGRIASFIANMISVGGCASAGFADAGALVPPTSVGGAPQEIHEMRYKLSG